MWSDQVTLLSYRITGSDSDLNAITATDEKTIFCSKYSISNSDFYANHQSKIKMEWKLVVHYHEYEYQTDVRLDGKLYHVIRTYKIGDVIELYISEKQGEYESI